MKKVLLSNVALECYLDGGSIAVYSIMSSSSLVHPDDVKEFAFNNGAIGDFKDASVSIYHLMDGSIKYLILCRF